MSLAALLAVVNARVTGIRTAKARCDQIDKLIAVLRPIRLDEGMPRSEYW
jgi:hypothetical protein